MRKENEIFLITTDKRLLRGEIASYSTDGEKYEMGIRITNEELPDGLLKIRDLNREYSLPKDSLSHSKN